MDDHQGELESKYVNRKFMNRYQSQSLEVLDENVIDLADDRGSGSSVQDYQHYSQRRSHYVAAKGYNNVASYGMPRHRSSTSEDDEHIASRNEIRKKSKELHQLIQGASSAKRNGRKDQNKMNEIQKISPTNDVGYVISDNITNGKTMKDHKVKRKEKKLKDISLLPDFSTITGNETNGAVLCEKLFGIIVFQYSNGKVDWQQIPKDSKLVVQSIVEGPNYSALSKVSRGDMLIRINEEPVSWFNFSRLMSTVRKRERVTLTFQSPRIVGPKSSYRVLQIPEGDLCLAILGKRLSHIQAELSHHPCVALFLTLSQSNNQDDTDLKEDIVYAFPSDEESLTSLRGLFFTLSSSVKDIVSQRATGSQIVLQAGKVNVAYSQCGADVLLIAMPAMAVSQSALSNLLSTLHSLLVLLFADVRSAFTDCDKVWLDKVLSIMFHEAIGLHSCLKTPTSPAATQLHSSTSSYGATIISSRCSCVKILPLSHDNKLICDEILCELESMEFDDYLEKEDVFTRKKFIIRGTSLFYKDYLLRSHLSKEMQCDINLFLHCHGLFTLSSRDHVDQVFAWQEFKSSSSCDTSSSSCIGYKPYSSRTFLLLLGMHHYLLAVIVEAGDSSSITMSGALHPSSFLTEQSRNTLSQLETTDVQMAKYCEERLTKMDQMIVLASADQLCSSSSPRNKTNHEVGIMKKYGNLHLRHSPKPNQESPWKLRSKSVDNLVEGAEANGPAESVQSVLMRRQGSKMSFGSNDSGGSGSSSGHPKSKSSRQSSNTDLSNISHGVSTLHIPEPYLGVVNKRICRGREPVLFYFMTVQPGEGILICPTEGELSNVSSPLQHEVWDNFHAACIKMQQNFISESEQEEKDKSAENPFATPGSKPKEQGVMFECSFQSDTDKKTVYCLQYWVVGRRRSQSSYQEMYVCFHESTPQSMVEMAFSLGFGT